MTIDFDDIRTQAVLSLISNGRTGSKLIAVEHGNGELRHKSVAIIRVGYPIEVEKNEGRLTQYAAWLVETSPSPKITSRQSAFTTLDDENVPPYIWKQFYVWSEIFYPSTV